MNLPVYVPLSDVRQACRELGIRDWTQLTRAEVSLEEARIVRDVVGAELAQMEEAALGA